MDEKVDLNRLLNNARYFKIAADRCLPGKKANEELQNLLIPSIVNLSFSLELYLKYLIYKLGKEPWGHDLFDLYSDLSFEIKRYIESRVNIIPNITFENCLKNNANVFTKWRYSHETSNLNKINPKFLHEICLVIEIIIDDSPSKT